MKKFFSLILLFLILASTHCLAIEDFRFIKNQSLIDCIKKQINIENLREASNLEGNLHIDYESIIFMVNEQNINIVKSAVPILNFNKSTITNVGELIIEIKIEEVEKIDDVFSIFTLNNYNFANVALHKVRTIFLTPHISILQGIYLLNV